MQSKSKERVLFVLGLLICFSVAAASVLLEKVIPGELLGASIIALFMGTIINSFFHPKWIQPALKFTSKKILQWAVIILGFSLNLGTIAKVGTQSLPVIICTISISLITAFFMMKLFWYREAVV